MKKLWLDIGNTRLKYWITQDHEIVEHGAEMHLQSPADLLLGLMQHFKKLNIQSVGVSSVLDLASNQHIRQLLQRLKVPVICAQVHAQYAGLSCGYGLQHLGGYILPNLYLQRDALIQNTKGIKIPDAAFDNLQPGRNTIDAVHHGILLGLVSSIEKVLATSPRDLVLTGGDAALFAEYLQAYQPRVEPDLLLKGLQYFFSQHPDNKA